VEQGKTIAGFEPWIEGMSFTIAETIPEHDHLCSREKANQEAADYRGHEHAAGDFAASPHPSS
jgi:hypothetical protein